MRYAQAFRILVRPTAKGRGRVAVRGEHAVIYTPEATRNAEAAIRDALRAQGAFLWPRGAPIAVDATFTIPRPNEAPRRERFHPRRPDLPNYLMLLCDAGTGVLWHDDAQVVQLHAVKRYGDPMIVVRARVLVERDVPPHRMMRWELELGSDEPHAVWFARLGPVTGPGAEG